MIRHLLGALGAIGAGALVAVVGLANPAFGHVTVDPATAEQGGYARVVFRVPNERNNASTTKVQVYLPKSQPVASVRTMPVPGWTVSVEYRSLAKPIQYHGQRITSVVNSLTWIPYDPDFAIGPNEFQEFPVSLGPLPTASSMVFKTLQTYNSGEVVRWIEPPTQGKDPEHPAPVLELAAAPAAKAGATEGAANTDTTAPAAASSVGTPLWLGIVGVAAGLIALILALVAYGRTRPENSLFDDDGDSDEAVDEDTGYPGGGFVEDDTVTLSELEDDAGDEETTERVHTPGRSKR